MAAFGETVVVKANGVDDILEVESGVVALVSESRRDAQTLILVVVVIEIIPTVGEFLVHTVGVICNVLEEAAVETPVVQRQRRVNEFLTVVEANNDAVSYDIHELPMRAHNRDTRVFGQLFRAQCAMNVLETKRNALIGHDDVSFFSSPHSHIVNALPPGRSIEEH